jgi:AmiR/NasT family two-component response regulator
VEEIERAEVLTKMGAAYVLHANQLNATQQLAEQLKLAVNSRALIEQAKGILMAKHGIDAATAFDWLRKASMNSNLKLRDIAREVTERPDAV